MQTLKRFYFIFILGFLFIFLIQKELKLFSIEPLLGTQTVTKQPVFTWKRYFNLSWQEEENIYLNENMGFRPLLVHCYNQLSYDLFNRVRAQDIVAGKNNNTFVESYITNYLGLTYTGKTNLDKNIYKIKVLQDSLKKMDTDLIIIFTSGKATYCAEDIPDYYLNRKKDTTNYTYYSAMFLKNKINFIDFNSYFLNNKKSFKYPIYSEYGTHWTPYASAVAMDSIIHYIEALRFIDLPEFDYSDIEMKDPLNLTEYDIGSMLNLLSVPPHKPMPYPRFKYKYNSNNTRPDVLVIGDSYWFCIEANDIPGRVFKMNEFWYYNNDIYKNTSKEKYVVTSRLIVSFFKLIVM